VEEVRGAEGGRCPLSGGGGGGHGSRGRHGAVSCIGGAGDVTSGRASSRAAQLATGYEPKSE
jgi:hypothetical protein